MGCPGRGITIPKPSKRPSRGGGDVESGIIPNRGAIVHPVEWKEGKVTTTIGAGNGQNVPNRGVYKGEKHSALNESENGP